jgi:aerobic carbon-monoxide dehydrogenase large subunit
MVVEIDPATMELRILKYVVVHDCGTVINPLIVAGWTHLTKINMKEAWNES